MAVIETRSGIKFERCERLTPAPVKVRSPDASKRLAIRLTRGSLFLLRSGLP